jgi:transcription elongation GreA/GreB family factor
VHELVSDLSAHRQKHILPVIKKSFPDWEQRIKAMVPSAGGKLLTEIVDFLVVEGKESELASVFERSLHEHRAGADLMIWLCKNRDEPSYAKWLPPLINGRLLSVILQQLEAMALENNGIRKNSLTELLLNDTTVIADLVRSCDAEETRDLGKSVLMNPAIEELDKRSLMARLIKVSPSVQSLLVSNQHTQTEALVVSWESLERRKQEYDEIINKKIPENTKEIAIARSYGDLRENHEFKAAKEMQTVLMRQKAELEQMLSRARGTDFYKPDVTAVNIGTRVTIEPLDGGSEASYTILGAWDSDPDKGIISYQTATAAVMLGHKIGEQVNLPGEQGERSVRITKIEAAFPEGAAQPFDSVQPGDASSLQEASSPNAEVGGSNANA